MPTDLAAPNCGLLDQADLDALLARLTADSATSIGFPAATDIDYRVLAPFLGHMLNNLGDPNTDGIYPAHTKSVEREVVQLVAELLRAPAEDRWGYVTSGATEGTEQALYLARQQYPRGIVYHSAAAHHSVTGAIDRLGMRSVAIRAMPSGEIDYEDLLRTVGQHRTRPAIVVATIGTGMSEAADDVASISAILDNLAVSRRWIHADAALSGLPLALLDAGPAGPRWDFTSGADSVIVSGHKTLGTPVPCGVLVVRNSLRSRRQATYTGSPDSTLNNSRSGFAAVCLWYGLRHLTLDGHRDRIRRARALAAYLHGQLVELGWAADRHAHAFTVVLDTPPDVVAKKWALPSDGQRSHIVVMPGVTQERIDGFLADLRAAVAAPAPSPATVAEQATLRRSRLRIGSRQGAPTPA